MGDTLLCDLDPKQVYSFLIEKNVLQGTAEKLLNENLSGHMLVELSYDDLKDVVGILQAKFVKKKVDEHLLDQETIFETNNPILKRKAEKQVLRKFGKDVEEGFSYIKGEC